MTLERIVMTKSEILEQLTLLDLAERLAILEDALHGVREELARRRADAADAERSAKLAAAALALLPDYEAGGELTAFTSLDAEPVHAPG
jgi:hypothetical protein